MTRSDGCLPSGSFSMRQIMQWYAAKRRETGAEDEPGIGEVGVGDDAFFHCALSFREIRCDQPLDELGPISVALALHRSSVLPAIDALSAFLAELARRHLRFQDARHLDIACGLGERLAGV